MRRRGTANLDDIRRSLRLGMGPCQGGFCIYRATGILHGVGRLDGEQASESLRRLPAGALEGRVADPVRRPAAPGAARRLDLPGAARRGAPAVKRRRDARGRRRPGRPDRGGAAGRGRRARARARQGRRRDPPEPVHDRRARLRARARRAPRRGARGARRGPPVRGGRARRRSAAAVEWFRKESLALRRRPGGEPAAADRGGRAEAVGVVPETMAAATCATAAPVRGRLPRAEGLPRRAAGRQPRARGRRRRGRWSSTCGPRPRGRELARLRARVRRSGIPGEVVGSEAAGSGEERVAFPAVLGIAERTGWSELQDRLGRPVFEVPTLPPSVPGMRVRVLRERLRRAGGRVILNDVVVGAERATAGA